jgi:hypothetical protein
VFGTSYSGALGGVMKDTMIDWLLLGVFLSLMGSCMHSYMTGVDVELQRYEERVKRQAKRLEV